MHCQYPSLTPSALPRRLSGFAPWLHPSQTHQSGSNVLRVHLAAIPSPWRRHGRGVVQPTARERLPPSRSQEGTCSFSSGSDVPGVRGEWGSGGNTDTSPRRPYLTRYAPQGSIRRRRSMVDLYDERCARLRVCQGVLRRLQRVSPDRRIVALGLRVHLVLHRHGIPHLALVHPAARGAIRRRALYQSHVRAVLEGGEAV
jgi:hypothetical protein